MLKASLTAVAALVLIAHAASAATVEVAVDANNTIPGVVANSIIADGEGNDWTGIVVRVDLTSGGVHNGSPDSNGPQSAFWTVPGFEQLEWDTWFGIPGDPTRGFVFNADNALGCGIHTVSGQHICTSSVNTRTTDTGPVRVGNVSLSANAQGTWQTINQFTGGVLVQSAGDVINGVMVPEPSALALLAVGGLALMNRAYKE